MWGRVKQTGQTHLLVVVPTYLEFVKLRTLFNKESASWCAPCPATLHASAAAPAHARRGCAARQDRLFGVLGRPRGCARALGILPRTQGGEPPAKRQHFTRGPLHRHQQRTRALRAAGGCAKTAPTLTPDTPTDPDSDGHGAVPLLPPLPRPRHPPHRLLRAPALPVDVRPRPRSPAAARWRAPSGAPRQRGPALLCRSRGGLSRLTLSRLTLNRFTLSPRSARARDRDRAPRRRAGMRSSPTSSP